MFPSSCFPKEFPALTRKREFDRSRSRLSSPYFTSAEPSSPVLIAAPSGRGVWPFAGSKTLWVVALTCTCPLGFNSIATGFPESHPVRKRGTMVPKTSRPPTMIRIEPFMLVSSSGDFLSSGIEWKDRSEKVPPAEPPPLRAKNMHVTPWTKGQGPLRLRAMIRMVRSSSRGRPLVWRRMSSIRISRGSSLRRLGMTWERLLFHFSKP